MSSCCGGGSSASASNCNTASGQAACVSEYYGKVLEKTEDLRTDACLSSVKPSKRVIKALQHVPKAVLAKYYGCGECLPADDLTGMRVLDLGSGSGRDVYVAAQLVGPTGSVVGVDMTTEQLDVARGSLETFESATGLKNVSFVEGRIEDIETLFAKEPASFDVITSNCVINLCQDKEAVLRGAYAVLKDGGEFYFSDVYSDRRLSPEAKTHPVLVGECIGGAMYEHDFLDAARAAGFADPRVVSRSTINIDDDELRRVVGPARFSSVTYRLFKLPALEKRCEDYGEVATYLGNVPGVEDRFTLDAKHVFEEGKPYLVCGNTSMMLQDTRLSKYFRVTGDRTIHFGLFPC